MKRVGAVRLRAEHLGELSIIHSREKDSAAILSIKELLLERLVREEGVTSPTRRFARSWG